MNIHRSRFSGFAVPMTVLALALVALLLGLSARPAGANGNADITIIKDADPEDDTEFAFSGDLGDFTLSDPSDNSENFLATPGAISVYESVPGGWNLVDINCSGADSSHILNGNDIVGVTISAESDSEISCTFYNEQESADITIYKVADPADNTEFEFFGDLGNFSLYDPSDNSEFFQVTPGSYDVSESIPQGWLLEDVDCTGGNAELLFDDDILVGVTFTAEDGDEFSCTFYNDKQRADLTVYKDADPEDNTEFEFTGDLGNFSLSVPSQISDTFTELLPGLYYVYETIPDGWLLVDVQCDSAEVEFLYDGLDVIGAIITLEDEDAVNCTFYNEEQAAEITIWKDADPEDNTEFEFTGDLGNFSLFDPNDDNETFTVAPGQYAITEIIPQGWMLEYVDCTGGNPELIFDDDILVGVTFTVEDDDEVTCTFFNEEQSAELTIVKDADPEEDTEFDFTGDLGDFSLSVPTTPSETFTELLPGTYTVYETVPEGWMLVDVQCDSAAVELIYDGLDLVGAIITLIDEDVARCTFYNEQASGQITIEKFANPADNTLFAFTGDLGDFSLQDPIDNSETFAVAPGEYEVTELTPDGWNLDQIVCNAEVYVPVYDDEANQIGVNVTVEVDDDITCSFYNVEQSAQITIVKSASPEDDTEFDFIGDLGPFTLKDPSNNNKMFVVPPGTYEITELIPFGWVLNTVNCSTENREDVYDDGNNFVGVEITVGDGEDATCTFNNVRGDSSLTIVKEATPADDTEFDFYGDPPGFTLKDPSDNSRTFPLFPGTYGVYEDMLAGWVLVDVNCEGGTFEEVTDSGNLLGVVVTVPVEGEVTCTFYNEPTPPPSTCPFEIEEVGNELTMIIGKGMGNTSSASNVASFSVPNTAELLALYGQLADKQTGTIKHVRFIYPDKSFVQVQPATSLGQHAAVSWWGAELDVEELQTKSVMKGRFFPQAGAGNKRLPRAFILYPTYETEEAYANAFEVFAGTTNHVANGPGFALSQTFTLEIPDTQAVTDVEGQLALVDNDIDGRGYVVVITAGTSTQTLVGDPNSNTHGRLLDILSFSLADVAAGTSEVTIELTVFDLEPAERESVALVGATAHYVCGEVGEGGGGD